MAYIKLDRGIVDHWIYKDAEYFKVWFEMLYRARYSKDTGRELVEGQLTEVNYGEFIYGRIKWSQRLGITERRLRTLIDKMVADQMIEVVSKHSKFTIYRILNYSKYNQQNDQHSSLDTQGFEGNDDHHTDQQVTSKRPASDQQVTTKEESKESNTVNKDKEEKKKNTRQRKTLPEDSPPYKLAVYFLFKINEWTDEIKKPDMQNWADDCRKILELDKRDKHQIKEVIDWVTSDSFWRKNVLSPDKLRKQFPRLVISMQEEKQKAALREIQSGQQQTAAGKGRNGAPQKRKLSVVPDMPKGPGLPPEELAELYRLAERIDGKGKDNAKDANATA